MIDANTKLLLERYRAEILELRSELEDSRRKELEVTQEKFLQEFEEKASERVTTLRIFVSKKLT